MSTERKAIFLSYASQDAEAANKVCNALRAAGIEVWFDQSELRGGDAWDQKIRRQIKECALFVPIISANTQARLEGYFRLEWKLAEDRSHLMARGKPFIVPVTVDGTTERDAHVPDSFLAVQWTRIAGGDSSGAFCERAGGLLGGPVAGGPRSPEAAKNDPDFSKTASKDLGPPKGRRKALWNGVAAGALVVAAVITFWAGKSKPTNQERSKNQDPAAAASPALAADKSIAVLPFENLSDDKDNTAFFSDGMHEDILTNLANIAELRVVSRTSVMEYRGTKKKIPQIAKELGVAYILEGSVRRAGNTVRITGQLIRAANDEHLWAKSYDRELTPKEIFAIQAALSTEIAGALRAAISPETRKLLERRPTENLAAYDLYSKGRRYGTAILAELKQREKNLQDAVGLDPNFAEAWGELAAAHAAYVFQDFDHTPARLAKADAAIGKAMRLAPDAPEIIRLLGNYAYWAYRDYARATAQFEKVIRLQPNNSDAIFSLGLVQRRQGQWLVSLGNLRKAVELDPGQPSFSRNLLVSLVAARRWDEAQALQRRVVAARPDSVQNQAQLARLVFAATGSTREADDWLTHLPAVEIDSPRIVQERKHWAEVKADYAEWKRLGEKQPYFDDDGTPRWSQAVEAATVFAAHGDPASVRRRLGDFPAEVRTALERDPANALLWRGLSLMEALLGQKAEALRDARKVMELMPETLDPVFGPLGRKNLAAVYAWIGDKDHAVAEIAHFLQFPQSGTALSSVHTLRTDAAFAPLRNDPRFEALLNDPKNNAPLF